MPAESGWRISLISLVLVVWRVLACSAISPYEPEGREFESPRARHFKDSGRCLKVNRFLMAFTRYA